MRQIKKMMAAVIVVAMIVQCIHVNADIAKASVSTSSASLSLSIKGGTATCNAKVLGKTGTTKIDGTIKLQKVTSSSTKTIKSWSVSTKSRILNSQKTYSVSKGKYKVVFSFKVYKGGTSESFTLNRTATY